MIAMVGVKFCRIKRNSLYRHSAEPLPKAVSGLIFALFEAISALFDPKSAHLEPNHTYETCSAISDPKPILAGLEPLCSKGLCLLLTRPLQALSDQLNLLSQPQLNLLRPQCPDLPKPALLHPKSLL